MSCIDKCSQASKNNDIIAENMVKIYEEGLKDGRKEEHEKTLDITENGTTEVTPDEGKALSKVTVNVSVGGGDSFYDTFWDGLQQNGTRTDYRSAFSGLNWTADSFRPKYDIVSNGDDPFYTHYIFQNSTMAIDLEQHLKDCGVAFDTGNSSIGNSAFQNARFTVIPEIMISSNASANVFAENPNLHTIRKVTIRDKDTYANQFTHLPALVNIVLDGEIGKNLSFAQSPLLSDASVQSIIDHLADLTGSTTQKLTLHATPKGRLTTEQIAAATAKNWTIA